MVTPSANLARHVVRGSGKSRNEATTSNGTVRLSSAEPQVKVASMPYSFSQQMPTPLHQKKAPIACAKSVESLLKPTKDVAVSDVVQAPNGVQIPNGTGAWQSNSQGTHAKKRTTAAEIVAAKTQEESVENSLQEDSGALQEFELYSKLVPKTSIVPKIPGRVAKSSNVLRGPGRTAQSFVSTSHKVSSPPKPASKSPPSTRLQSLSSSSASVERRRKALGAAAAAAAVNDMALDSESNGSTNADLKSSRGESSNVSIKELEATIADRGRRDVLPTYGKGAMPLRAPAREATSLLRKPPRRTFSQYTAPTTEGKRNPFPRSSSTLSSSSFRNVSSRLANHSHARGEQGSVRSGSPSPLSKIIELRKGINSNGRNHASPRKTSAGISPPAGLGRAPAEAFFSGTQGRKGSASRSSVAGRGLGSRAHDRSNPPPPVPLNKRADALKEALSIGSKSSSQNNSDRRSATNRAGNFEYNSEYQRSNKESQLVCRSEEADRINGVHDTKNERLASEHCEEVPSNQNGNLGGMQISDGVLVQRSRNFDRPEAIQRPEPKRRPGVIAKPLSSWSRSANDARYFTANGNMSGQTAYASLWSEPQQYHSSFLRHTPGAAGSAVAGCSGPSTSASVTDDADVLPPIPTSKDPEFDTLLHQFGIRLPVEETVNDCSNQHKPNERFYSHF